MIWKFIAKPRENMATELKPGDFVEFIDENDTHWGPWTVVSIKVDNATVVMQDEATTSLPISSLRKRPKDQP